MTPAPAALRRRRVLIVDDSRTIRALLRATIGQDPRLEVAGEASDPYEARDLIKALNPDVITLDVEMPRMNGLVFLDHLMRLRPMPVVMVSTRTRERSEDAVRALSAGAVDCVDVARLHGDPLQRQKLTEALFCAASASVRARPMAVPAPEAEAPAPFRWNGRVVLIGSSTGGVEALERVLERFPADCPPTLIAQHMPEAFLKSFAGRLDDRLRPAVRLAEEGVRIAQGDVLLAPGGARHLALSRAEPDRIHLPPSRESDAYVPSVDVLFELALPHAPRVLAVMLTGMGRDGSAPMRRLRDGGARTLAQDGESCVVDGMPRAAREAGAVESSVPLDRLGDAILAQARKEFRS